MMLAMGEHLVEDMANFFRFPGDSSPGVERFEFDQARERLAAAGYRLTPVDAAWRAFSARRAHYASRLNALALNWITPPTQWIGDRALPGHHEEPEDDMDQLVAPTDR